MTKRRSYKKDFEQSEAQRQQLEQEVKLLREQLDAQKAEPPSTQERWLKRNIITLEVIGIIIAISSTILAYFVYQQTQKQTDFLGNQTAIMAHQDTLIQNQNDLFGQQNDLFRLQNTKVDTQNYLVGLQTDNLIYQNRLFEAQNEKLDSQNVLFNNQNERLDVQIALSEADRRSALVFLMSNIMDKVDEELKDDWNNDGIRNISPELIGRIAALSQAMKPYRYLRDSVLIERPLSPERGQLLMALVKTKLDSTTYRNIYQNVFFQQADLYGAHLISADLGGANLRLSDLSTSDLRKTNLRRADFTRANLKRANLSHSDLTRAYLRWTNLTGAWFIKADLSEADLGGSNLKKANLRKANLNRAYLRWAKLQEADLSETYLHRAVLSNALFSNSHLIGTNFKGAWISKVDFSYTDLSKVENISHNKLLNAKSLYNCQGIPDSLLTRLQKEKPELFEKPDDWIED